MSHLCMTDGCGRPAVYHMNPRSCRPDGKHHYCEGCWEDALRRDARTLLDADRKAVPAGNAHTERHGGIKRHANTIGGYCGLDEVPAAIINLYR